MVHVWRFSNPSSFVPFDALIERDRLASKDVKRTPDGEVDLAIAEALDQFQICYISATTSVRHRNRADLGQVFDKSFIDAGLQAFGIGCMD